MTLEELLMKEDDGVILDIYNELESCVVPATGYAHAYCRKVNKMINAGNLCTVRDKYRNVYLPTLSKAIFKEMARRYACHCYNTKTIEQPAELIDDCTDIADGVETIKCRWCDEVVAKSDTLLTDLGTLCTQCVNAIISRGEEVTVYA